MIALMMMLQAVPAPAPTPAPAPAGQRFSILVDPCASANDDTGKDIVVCGHPDGITPRLPLRDYRGPPDHAVPSNPDMRGIVALNGPGIGNECGAYGENCPVGFGGYAMPVLLNGAADLVKSAFAKKPDKRGRVAIDLDGPPAPIPAGAIRP